MNLISIGRVAKINKKSNARVFKDTQVGDVLKFSTAITYQRGSNGCYATQVNVENTRTGERDYIYMSVLSNILKNYTLHCRETEEFFDEFPVEY